MSSRVTVEYDPELLALARRAKQVAVITGAGISSESGIPTFRGAGESGALWKNFRAEELATPQAFARDPELVWEWYDWRREICAASEPNKAHEVVAAMDAHYENFLLITQNVDNLHRRAGSRRLYEIHGNIFRGRCVQTGRSFDLPAPPLDPLPPRSPFADAPARPDIVWFGESYDQEMLGACLDFLAECELVFVIGTSGMVPIPIYLADHARKHGAVIVDVNPEVSGATEIAAHYWQGRAGDALPPFWEQI